jgi:hypothetical protein
MVPMSAAFPLSNLESEMDSWPQYVLNNKTTSQISAKTSKQVDYLILLYTTIFLCWTAVVLPHLAQ